MFELSSESRMLEFLQYLSDLFDYETVLEDWLWPSLEQQLTSRLNIKDQDFWRAQTQLS